ncbi:MAG: sodium:proton antiporter [Oscillospiraceae bacterium]|nr:sodium:proton antiporter [Oscillospiraceae bacterium]
MPFLWNVPFLCVFLTMVTAILLSVVPGAKLSYYVTLGVSILCAVLSFAFLLRIVQDDCSFAFTMGKFPAPFGNEIKAGPLQALLVTVFSAVMSLALIGGKTELFEDVDEKKMGLACVMMNMVLASLMVLTYTNDAFTAYVFIEISTIAACALVMIKDTGPTLVATIRYLFMSLLGSGLFLFSVILLYAVTGHLLMPQLTETVAKLMASGSYHLPLALCLSLMTAGLGIKAAMFPFHRWLPDAHGTATTASSAVLSGLVLKGYAVLMITMFCRVFTLDTVRLFHVNDAVFVLGLLGMILGSVRAIREHNAKRMLAYSSVAQLGYVFMGIGLGTEAGVAAACFQIIAHACTKSLLFLCVGRLSSTVGHSKHLAFLRGSGWEAPIAGLGFGVGALSMVGIPLFGGFAAKVHFANASIAGDEKILLTLLVLAVSSILNALYYIPAVIAVWSDRKPLPAGVERDRANSAAVILLSAAVIFLGVNFQPIMDIIVRGLQLM